MHLASYENLRRDTASLAAFIRRLHWHRLDKQEANAGKRFTSVVRFIDGGGVTAVALL